jgi:hypothetical protein
MTALDDSLDALGGPAFDRLYDAQIRPELEQFEARRGRALAIFICATAAGLGLAIIVAVFQLHPALVAVSLILPAVIGYQPLDHLARDAKRAVIDALCAPLGIRFQIDKFQPPGWDRLLSLHLLPKPDDSTFQDLFTGRRGASAFSICEATLTQGSGKSRQTVFSGQLVKITAPRAFSGTTVVLRDSGWLNRFECPAGLKKVGLEDPHFEHIFEVFGDDQVEARVLLTPIFMDALLSLEQAFAGHHIRCGFCDGDFLVAVEGPNRFEIGGMFTSLVDRGRVDRIVGDLRALTRLIDVFLEARP